MFPFDDVIMGPFNHIWRVILQTKTHKIIGYKPVVDDSFVNFLQHEIFVPLLSVIKIGTDEKLQYFAIDVFRFATT